MENAREYANIFFCQKSRENFWAGIANPKTKYYFTSGCFFITSKTSRMNTQQFPEKYKDLPVIHVYGSARLVGGRRFVIAGLFFMLFSVYYLLRFDTYWYESPTHYSNWRVLYYSFPSDFWWGVLAVVIMVPWVCTIAGLLIFVFSPKASKKTGRILGITSLVCLEIWHLFTFRAYNPWYKHIIGGSSESWLLFGLFTLVLVFCWERRGKVA